MQFSGLSSTGSPISEKEQSIRRKLAVFLNFAFIYFQNVNNILSTVSSLQAEYIHFPQVAPLHRTIGPQLPP